ncbi:thiamine pyrophosphate-binding protein [Brevibacillus sp. B_LB10_24]|uniref:thiamine pyrophosphate-binding protein n=1 Tax=Brevibacillus sp. B_LB10_24 TaxID=3380645 RepID=UPI0038BD72A8
MHVGDALVQMLVQMKADTVFGVPGGQTLPLYDGIHNAKGKVRHIVMRAEKNAAYAAVAYARLTNRVGVCDATVGPGAAEFTAGLGEAFNSSTPIFALFSDLPLEWEHLRDRGNASQGFYQLEMVKPFTKWTGRITSQKALPDMIRNAFIKAVSGRPGPVALSIHEDVFKEAWSGDVPDMPDSLAAFPRYRSVAADAQIELALSILTAAEKPVMIVGGGAMLSQAEAEVTALAEALTIPVLQTFTGRGVIPDDHPLGIGMAGGIGTLSAKQLAEEADVVFLVGFKSGQNTTFTWQIPTSQQTVIHLDIDEEEIGRVFQADVGLVGDAKATLAKMLQLAAEKTLHRQYPERQAWIAEAKKNWDEYVQAEISAESEWLKPQQVLDVLNRIAQPDDILVCDASFSSGWGAVYFKHKAAGRRLLTPRGLAGLGFGLPAAIGAAAAGTRGEVYLLAGDGGFGYTVGELATLQAYGLKVNILVLDNRNWGWMEWLNKLNYDKEYFDLPAVDFAKVSAGFGLQGFRVKGKKQLAEALAETRKSTVSTVIHVDTTLWETPVLGFREAIGRRQNAPVKYM